MRGFVVHYNCSQYLTVSLWSCPDQSLDGQAAEDGIFRGTLQEPEGDSEEVNDTQSNVVNLGTYAFFKLCTLPFTAATLRVCRIWECI